MKNLSYTEEDKRPRKNPVNKFSSTDNNPQTTFSSSQKKLSLHTTQEPRLRSSNNKVIS